MSNQIFIQQTFDGPVDIVGDIHGEIDALHQLLKVLGYDLQGRHPEQRKLILSGICVIVDQTVSLSSDRLKP